MTEPPWSPATTAVTAGRPERLPDAPLNVPITMASTYVATGDLEYGRYGNPTWTAFEEALGTLEGGRCISFASGLSAVASVLDLVGQGATVVAPRHAYNGTVMQLADLEARGRVRANLVDITDTEGAVKACEDAALVWLESPTNPALEVADIETLAAAAHDAGAYVVVDNTFATPLRQLPLTMGADVVVHSATKYLSGHTDVVLGAVVVTDAELYDVLKGRRDLVGAIPGTLEAWLALRGLRTLHLRLERAQASAADLARRLAGHPAVERVRHPSLPQDPGHELAKAQMSGFGAIVSLEVRGGAAAADAVQGAVRLWLPATSLGGVESTLERRRRHPLEPTVVPESLLRLSVGVEDVEDLWTDLAAALDAATGA
jgi:cystathionine gamma-synthase